MDGRLVVFALLFYGSLVFAVEPKHLSFEQIQSFTNSKTPRADALIALNRILHKVYGEPRRITDAKIKSGPSYQSIRVTDWNIERGFKFDLIKSLIQDSQAYVQRLAMNQQSEFKEELDLLKDTDIFTLNEVDWGIQRTGYRNIASEFAQLFNANYSFATEFLELAPGLLNDPQLDKSKYKGLHGNAIVSKFPIVSSKVLRLPTCYDWFSEELTKLSVLERIRRESSDIVINEKIITEIRQGSRLALFADIKLPNGDLISVISTHLENRTEPFCRERQLQAILDHISTIQNPVILAGDLNNFEKSAESTSFKKAFNKRIRDPGFMAMMGINYFNPYSLITNVSTSVVGFIRKHRNPTKINIPVILPNKARKLFLMIKRFRFADLNGFDLSGDNKWSYRGKSSDNRFSNSNQIARIGFVETFKFNRSFGVAKYKIDWIFVKPIDRAGRQQYFPAFGRTLKDFNQVTGISDHHPITVELIL